jgi:tetratricopeptide (TPR) repeat protein
MRHLNRGEPDRALEAFTQAIHLDPEFAPGYFQRAQIHQVHGQLAEAISDLSRAIELARQLDVLRCIHAGCPDGRWDGFSYKAVAIALQSRRLVEVSKHGGTWSATLLPAGVHYLANGDYPPGHWQSRRGRASTGDERAVGPTGSKALGLPTPLFSDPPKPGRPPTSPSPDGLTPTRKLLKDIIDAGGILERNTKDDKRTTAASWEYHATLRNRCS